MQAEQKIAGSKAVGLDQIHVEMPVRRIVPEGSSGCPAFVAIVHRH